MEFLALILVVLALYLWDKHVYKRRKRRAKRFAEAPNLIDTFDRARRP